MAADGRREPAIFGSLMIARNFKNWQGMNRVAEEPEGKKVTCDSALALEFTSQV
jgi:hypothetical protein